MESNHRLFAVVTGASSGIGYELARVFAKNRYDLLVTSGSDGAEEAARDFGGLGTDVQSVQADLTKYEGVEKLWQAIKATGRRIDAIAINAGVGVGGKFAETDLEKELNLIQLNVTSTVHLAKYVVRDMLARGSGRILFTSSIAGTMPTPLEAVYGASKAFVLSFTEALARELEPRGVRVTALCPGPVKTEFQLRAGLDARRPSRLLDRSADQVAQAGYDGFMAGKRLVIPGVGNKILSLMPKLLPRSVVLKTLESYQRGRGRRAEGWRKPK